MPASATDQIRKQLFMKAAPSRVWQALADAAQFGAWFRVKLESPFVPGYEQCQARFTPDGSIPGREEGLPHQRSDVGAHRKPHWLDRPGLRLA